MDYSQKISERQWNLPDKGELESRREATYIDDIIQKDHIQGRLWHSLILQRWKPIFLWLPIETLIQEKQEGYYKELNESNSLNECTPFVTFMLEVIRDALAAH